MCSRPEPSTGIWSHGARRWTPQDVQNATAINRRRSTTSLIPKGIRHLVTKDRRLRGSLNKGCVSDLIELRLEVWNRLFSNRLFSRDKKYNKATKNMVITGSTQNTCWYADYKFRASWIAFNASSRIASTSVIFCLSSSADPGIFSRLLQMALPSLTVLQI